VDAVAEPNGILDLLDLFEPFARGFGFDLTQFQDTLAQVFPLLEKAIQIAAAIEYSR
jgi:hypothetical protein